MTESAFKVTFGCDNCGNEWTNEFPAGTEVSGSSLSDSNVRVICEDNELGHDKIECDICKLHVNCPVCALKDYINILDRNPL